MANQDFIQALSDVGKHIDIARGFNDPIELCKDEISPELLKLTRDIEAELQLLRMKINVFITKNND